MCAADAARLCHCAMATGGGAGWPQRQPSRAQVSRKTVIPIHLCQMYHCSFRGEMGSGTIDSPSDRFATISTAVSQCSAIVTLLYLSFKSPALAIAVRSLQKRRSTTSRIDYSVAPCALPQLPWTFSRRRAEFVDGRPNRESSGLAPELQNEGSHAAEEHLHGDRGQHESHQALDRDHPALAQDCLQSVGAEHD